MTDMENRVDAFLDSLRDDHAALTAFFRKMPKGGDLHHHFDGSVYSETYFQAIVENDYWINIKTLDISADQPGKPRRHWKRVSTLSKQGQMKALRDPLIRKWSVKDYAFASDNPPDRHFFSTFSGFLPALDDVIDRGLINIRQRAIAENVQYIETIFLIPSCSDFRYPEASDPLLRYIQEKKDEDGLYRLFDIMYGDLVTAGLKSCATDFNRRLRSRHDSLQLDDERFMLRYQNFVLRIKPPSAVFADMALGFESAATSPLAVSVNIVAPEHHPVALQDYWLHMHMYRYLSSKYPRVRKALHAGELALGMTPPEDLSWHVGAALRVAGADRIGHGTDLPHENGWNELLEIMKNKPVPVEITLTSNAYILGMEVGRHPLKVYERAGVPIVISTDDAGVLRSDLSSEYVKLTEFFPELDYGDIKRLVYNSLRYSFIEDENLKSLQLRELDRRFDTFEAMILESHLYPDESSN